MTNALVNVFTTADQIAPLLQLLTLWDVRELSKIDTLTNGALYNWMKMKYAFWVWWRLTVYAEECD